MRRSPKVAKKVPSDLDAALAAMSAEGLREIVHEVLHELDDRAHARVVGSLIARAARAGAGFAPAAVSDEQVSEVLAFVKAAKRVGQADPSEVDQYLRRGSAAFLRKDYAVAHRVLGALLPPIGEGHIDLGQHELVDEVLGADVAECATRYVVSAYMLDPVAERVEAVRTAIDRVQGVGRFWEPLRELERVAVEPLHDLAAFLPRWRALLAEEPAGERTSDWDTREDRWLRDHAHHGSSGSIGTAVNNAIAELVPIIASAPVDAKTREAWLERLFEAYLDDGIPYIERLGDHWGALCASTEVASAWAERLMEAVKLAWSPDPSPRGYFKGTTNCLSALIAAERYDDVLALLELAPYKMWHYREYGVKALAAKGKKPEAVRYAEKSRGRNKRGPLRRRARAGGW